MSSPNQPPTFPAIRLIAAGGDVIAALVGLVPVLAAIWAVAAGFSWLVVPAGLLAGALLWLVLRSYVEVLRILSDTLMPR